MILTVTLNTALDLTYRVPRLEPHGSHRVQEMTERPGGKGLNVSRVLAALGHRTVVTGVVGGRTGEHLRALLTDMTAPGAAATGGAGTGAADAGVAGAGETGGGDAPLTDALVTVRGATRRTMAVVDESTGDTTQLNERGPHLTQEEWKAFLHTYRELLQDGPAAVALCGSLPPGVPVGAYAALIREAHAAGVPAVLDTSGEPLRRGLAARPGLVKPNLEELAGITGTNEPLRAARAARRRGAGAVVLSRSAEGLLAVTPEQVWQAAPPRRISGNPTGAGDSVVAGLLSGLVEELSWPERLARAVALSAATVAAPAAGEFDANIYADLLPRVEVTEPASAA